MQGNKINLEVGYGIGKGTAGDAFTIGAETAQEALSHIKEHPLSAVIVFASAHYEPEELLRGIKKVVGNAPLAGATTAGEICNERRQESVVVVALASPHLRMKVGIGKGVSRNWQEALAQAINNPEVSPFFSPQNDTIWSELTQKGKSAFGLLFSPGNTQSADSCSFEILEELKRFSLGRLPFIGGAAADDWRMETNHILCSGGAFPDSLLVAVFETRLKFGISVAHGFRPSLQRALATYCRGHEVLELDNRPADEIYSRLMGIPRGTLEGKYLTLTTGRPLGTPDLYGQYSLNVASYFTKAGGVRFAQPVLEGTVLTVMEANPDEMVAAGPEALRKALLRGSITEPSLVLVFSCALRTRILGERIGEEISVVKNLVPKVPVIGFYSFGEQGLSDDGVNRHNNMVIALLVIGRNLSHGAQVALENERLRLEVMKTTALKQANEALQWEIAERQRVEASLAASQARFEAIFNCMGDAAILTDLERRIALVNPAAGAIFGYRLEEMLGRNTKFFYATPGGYEKMGRLLHHEAAEVGQQLYEVQYRRGDGTVFEGETVGGPVHDVHGNFLGFLGIHRDITERKRAEEALRRASEEWKRTFDAVPEFIMVLDENHRIRRVNRAMAEAFHCAPETLIGKYCYEVVHQTNAPPPFCPHVKTLLDGLTHTSEIQESGLNLLITTSLIKDNDGHTIGSVHLARDITESKRAEEEHLRFIKLQSLATLAGGIAHDFNNILTAILGNIGLGMLDPTMGDQGRKRLAAAEKACQQAQSLARQLLTFAKGGAPIKELLSLKNLVAEAGSLACRGSQVRCEYAFAKDLLAIEGDPGQINQVFQNLIINAIQAMPQGGTVEITGENIKVGKPSRLPLKKGNYVKVSIKDKGIGIPEKYLQKIFDPYFTTKQQGSGLGLATAYSIVNKHHGHISVESKSEEGSTFQVYLPASDQKIMQQPREITELLSGKGKILVMDDEAMVREVLGIMLLTLGYEAQFARDGGEAIEMFSQAQGAADPFAAVILDLTVPGGMGGKEALKRLLKIDPQVKAVVSSGYFDDPIMADFQKYGFVGVIAKPYKVAELGKVLNKVLTSMAAVNE